MDAVERVIATLEAQVVGAEATLGAVGNAEERANATLVAKKAGSVTRGARTRLGQDRGRVLEPSANQNQR